MGKIVWKQKINKKDKIVVHHSGCQPPTPIWVIFSDAFSCLRKKKSLKNIKSTNKLKNSQKSLLDSFRVQAALKSWSKYTTLITSIPLFTLATLLFKVKTNVQCPTTVTPNHVEVGMINQITCPAFNVYLKDSNCLKIMQKHD